MERVDCFLKPDFDFIANHYIAKIKELENKLHGASGFQELIGISKEAFYLDRFVGDIEFFGYPNVANGLREIFSENFQDTDILFNLQNKSFNKAIDGLSGQFKIGENEYVLLDGKSYYKTYTGKWYKIDLEGVFLLLPKLNEEISGDITLKLEKLSKPTELHKIINTWQKSNFNEANDEYFLVESGETTPDEYTKKSFKQIEDILASPVSYESLDKFHHKGENFLEELCKVSLCLIDFIKNLKQRDCYPVYMLRDGIMFAEVQHALDIIDGEKQPNSQLMIGRKLLSKVDNDEYFWNLAVDALYEALRNSPDNFDQFYINYTEKLSELENEDNSLKELSDRLGRYIEKHILTQEKPILIIDTGLQGSINMLVKYIIDQKLNLNIPTDIRLFVVGDWFKGIYKDKYFSEYYPMMKDIEIFSRSDSLYTYKKSSFEQGKILVEMGSKENQILANIELYCLVILCKLI